jgi:hypothetical protein
MFHTKQSILTWQVTTLSKPENHFKTGIVRKLSNKEIRKLTTKFSLN